MGDLHDRRKTEARSGKVEARIRVSRGVGELLGVHEET